MRISDWSSDVCSSDLFVQFDSVPLRDRDMAAADRLAALLGNDSADFVIVHKMGAHFPIHDKYPDRFMRHRPALPRGAHEYVRDTGNHDACGVPPEYWRRYRHPDSHHVPRHLADYFD